MNKITLNELTPMQLYKIRKAIKGNRDILAERVQCHPADISRALSEPSNLAIKIREEALRLAQENGFDINELLNA